MATISRTTCICAGAGVTGLGAVLGLRRLRVDTRRTIYPAPNPPASLEIPDGWQLLGSPREGRLAVYSPPSSSDSPTVVYCHGNGQEVATELEKIPTALRQAGFGVAVIEYPGYGPLSAIECREDLLMSSALNTVRDLQKRPETNQIILIGLSLGTAVATYLASEGQGDLLLLAAPFTSSIEVTKALVGKWVPARLLLGPELLDSLARAPQVTIPTLVITGDHDEMFAPAMGRRLAKAFPNAHFVEVSDATHQSIREHIPAALQLLLSDQSNWPDRLPPQA